jgi:predicted alpha/beta hydrolase family esterase
LHERYHGDQEPARASTFVQPGPTVLVGHSFSGMIVSEVGVDPKVTALVYVAARAPDAGEDARKLLRRLALVEHGTAPRCHAFHAMGRISYLASNDEIVGLLPEHQLIAAGGI